MFDETIGKYVIYEKKFNNVDEELEYYEKNININVEKKLNNNRILHKKILYNLAIIYEEKLEIEKAKNILNMSINIYLYNDTNAIYKYALILLNEYILNEFKKEDYKNINFKYSYFKNNVNISKKYSYISKDKYYDITIYIQKSTNFNEILKLLNIGMQLGIALFILIKMKN